MANTNQLGSHAARLIAGALALVLALGVLSPPAHARQDESGPTPGVPIETPFWEVDPDELRLELLPLRQAELEAASEAWISALQEQVSMLARLQIAIDRSTSDEERAGLQSQLDRVRPRAIAMVELVEAVLNEHELKGGDVAPGRRYLSRVVAAAGLSPQRPTGEQPAAQPGQETAPEQEEPWQVPLKSLNNRLLPMTLPQLDREAEYWLARVQERVELMVAAEQAKETATGEALSEATRDAERYRQQRGALIERANAVLDSLEDKGGDAEQRRKYLIAAGEQPPLAWYNPQELWIQFQTWLVSPQGGIEAGLNLLAFAATLIAFWILAKILARAAGIALKRFKKPSSLLRNFVIGGVTKLVMLVGVVVAVAQLGVNIGPLVAAIGAAGLVIGLALQGTLSNFASGLLILFYKPFDVGDVINTGGVSGTVESMTLVSTVIVTFDNQMMILPNNAVWNGVITNVTGRPTRRVDMTVGVDYRSDLDRVRKILEEMVKAHPKVLADPAPNIKLNEYADSSINFIVRPWAKTGDYWEVYWDLQAQIKKRFDAEGISIPYPQHDINFNGPVEIISREA
ncbi:MAG: mechanosensitive ion channel domain-containing protein [Phycisphaerales bacterium]